MEGGLAMLRQLIGQVQERLELYSAYPSSSSSSSSSSTVVPPNFFLHLHPPPLHHPSWCFLNLDDSSIEDSCYNLLVTSRKSENLKMLEPGKPPPKKKPRKKRNRERSDGTAHSTEAMEDHIWKEFPEDLFEAVIARLPIATFFRFRSVCRKWHSMLTSQSFSEQCAQVSQPQPWFYTITHENVNTGAMYDPGSKKWHHPTIPALPTKLIVLPVASAGGLVCFLDIGHRSFYVCNPLTRSFKVLPARSVKVWSRVTVGMTLNGKSTCKGYKILWVGCDGEYEVYDSRDNSWSPGTISPSNIKLLLALNFKSHTVSTGNGSRFLDACCLRGERGNGLPVALLSTLV